MALARRLNDSLYSSHNPFGFKLDRDDLSDESDMKAKAKQMYARSNMLRQRFHFCSSDVKNKLFTTFFLIMYTCVPYG